MTISECPCCGAADIRKDPAVEAPMCGECNLPMTPTPLLQLYFGGPMTIIPVSFTGVILTVLIWDRLSDTPQTDYMTLMQFGRLHGAGALQWTPAAPCPLCAEDAVTVCTSGEVDGVPCPFLACSRCEFCQAIPVSGPYDEMSRQNGQDRATNKTLTHARAYGNPDPSTIVGVMPSGQIVRRH